MSALDGTVGEDYNGNMAQVSVDLPSELRRHLDARAADHGLADSAAYLRALAERDQRAYKADIARVQALIDEGISSGVCEKDAFQVLDELIADLRQPHG